MEHQKFRFWTLKQKWLNTILHLSSVIYRQKTQTFSSGFFKTIQLMGQIIVLEVIVSLISLPFYFFITPDKAFSKDEKQIKLYRLRRKITFGTLALLILFYGAQLLLGTWGLLNSPQSCEAALSLSMTVSGSYTGNGLDNRAITGLCFQPDVVMIKSTTTDYEIIRTSTMIGDASKQMNYPTAGLEANLIQSLDSDGFTIGNDNRVNRNSSTYQWVAFKGVTGSMKVGTFTGNGSNNHVITGVGFQPDFIMFIPANSTSATMRSSAMTNGKSYYFMSGDSGFTNGVNSFNTDGFTVSSYDLNSSGVVFHYIAWKKINGRMNVGSYTGNGTDNRNISGMGFQPEYVFIRGDGYYNVYQKSASLAGDNSTMFDNGAVASNKIQQLQTDGFQIGTDSTVNSSGISYFWIAFARSVPPLFTQSGYRFYTNQDSLNPGLPLAANNTATSLSGAGDAFRLRMLMHVSNDQLSQNGETFKLQYAEKGTGTCQNPAGTNPASYTDVTASTLIAYKDNTSLIDGTSISANSNDPTNGSYLISPQSYEESNNFTNSQSAIAVNSDGEWDFLLYDNGAAENTTYCLRIVRSDSSTPLDTYSVYPEITTALRDHTAPTILNITSSSANGTYGLGSNIVIQVQFDEPVNVTGTPQLLLATGAMASYTSGSGTDTLNFSYTVASSQNTADLDYQDINALQLNGGTIADLSNNNATLTLPIPGQNGSLSANKDLVIDTTSPNIIDVSSSNTNGTYRIGDILNLQIRWSEPVTVTGTPQLTLETGATDAVASYVSGSGTDTLNFTYTVASGENSSDLDYVDTNALNLHGSTIRDGASNDADILLPMPGNAGSLGANKNLVINTDVTPPTVTNISSSKADGTYSIGEAIPVTVEWSEPVIITGSPQLLLETGSSDATATYTSGSGTNTLTFTYTVAANEFSNDLDYHDANALSLNGGTIQDEAGNNATLTLSSPGTSGSLAFNKAIVIDTTPPDVTPPTFMNVTSSTANGFYKEGQTVSIQIEASENVMVSGTPKLLLNTGVYANYSSGSGSSILTFSYTIGSEENTADLDYASTDALDLNGGTIRDSAGNALINSLPSPASSGSLSSNKDLVIDTTAPSILNIISPQDDGRYGIGENILIQVQFSEDVNVSGTPQIILETGDTDAVANYTEGSGSDTLTFSYTVEAGQNSSDLDYQSETALSLNGGTIVDNAMNGSLLLLPTPGASNSLAANKNISIDTLAPTVTNVSSSATNGTYKIGDTIIIQLDWSEPVTVSGVPQLQLETGSSDAAATYISGSGTSTLNFSYTIAQGDTTNHLDYLNANALGLNGGIIKDSTNNNATLTLPAPGEVGSLGANKNLIIDGIAPAAVTLILSNPTSSSITINWIAPGDDGLNGTGSYYGLRYSTSPITAENYLSATEADYERIPQQSGTREQAIIENLLSATTYYFALTTEDDAENISALSNVPSLTTLDVPTPPTPPPTPPTPPPTPPTPPPTPPTPPPTPPTPPPTPPTRPSTPSSLPNGSRRGTSGGSGPSYLQQPQKDKPPVSSSSTQEQNQGQNTQIFSFADIANHWAKNYIQDLHDKCQITGYLNSNNSQKPFFKPDNSISRAELITMLMKCKYGIMPAPTQQIFTDVPLDHWAAPYIEKAVEEGVISLANKNFRPNDPANVAETLKMILLVQFDKQKIETLAAPAVCHDVRISDWFAPYFVYAIQKGIIMRYQNTQGLCQPANNITRAEVAKILMLNYAK